MPTTRTSTSHPIRVDFVSVATSGKLGMTFAPGKVQPHAASGAWKRDLAEDLRRLRNVYGTDVLVSVIEIEELRALRIGALASLLTQLGIRWIHVPVADAGVPTDAPAWLNAMRQVRAHLEDGETVVVQTRAVTHSGDSDSTGAITGNLLGVELGEGAIPQRWLADLELRDVVERLADDLAVLRLDGTVSPEAYPGV